MFRNTVFRACVVVFALTLVLVPRCLAAGQLGDVSDAWEKAGVMKKMIGLGDLPHAAEAGRDSLSAIRKAIDKETDSGRKDKLRDAEKYVDEAVGYADKGERSYAAYADGAIDKAIKILDELM